MGLYHYLLLLLLPETTAALPAFPTTSPTTSPTVPSWSTTHIVNTAAPLNCTAAAAISRLLTHLDKTTHAFTSIGWWQSANSFSAIISYDLVQNATTYQHVLSPALISLAASGRLLNVYNDDSLWWALALLDASSAYNTDSFISSAQQLWASISNSSQGTANSSGCDLEGGVYWTTTPGETYVNSITTAQLMLVSARLLRALRSIEYRAAAEAAQGWLRRWTMGDGGLLVGDGVQRGSCKVKGGAHSYSTGVYIGALVELYGATGDGTFLSEAEGVGKAAMETPLWTDGSGVFTEMRDDSVDSDGVGFKSILIRNLITLYFTTLNATLRDEIRGFVNTNYNMAYRNARKGDMYSANWNGPFVTETVWGQFVVVDLLVAGMAVNM